MSVLRLQGSASLGRRRLLFSMPYPSELGPGFDGLVGAKIGAGKTTLLSAFAGERTRTRAPSCSRLVTAWSPIAEIPSTVETTMSCPGVRARRHRRGAAWSPGARSVRARALGDAVPGRAQALANRCGARTRARRLLLDEPTNHLDVDARERLLGALRRFSGLAVIVSHDRAVLDALTTATLRIHRCKVTLWPGRFSAAKALWEQARAEQQSAHDTARERVRAAEVRLDTARRTQAAASKNVSTGARMKNPKDSDARGIPGEHQKQSGRPRRPDGSPRPVRDRARARAESRAGCWSEIPTLGGRISLTYLRAHGLGALPRQCRRAGPGAHVVLRDVRLTIESRTRGPRAHRRAERCRQDHAARGAGSFAGASRARPGTCPRTDARREGGGAGPSAPAGLRRARACPFPNLRRRSAASRSASSVLTPPTSLRARRESSRSPKLSQQARALVMDEPTNHLGSPERRAARAVRRGVPRRHPLVTHYETFAGDKSRPHQRCMSRTAP